MKIVLAAAVVWAGNLFAQSVAPDVQRLPPLPSDLPPVVTAPDPRTRLNPIRQAPATRVVSPRHAAVPTARPLQQESLLTWDSLSRDYTAKPGETSAHFGFSVTNNSQQEVTINWVRPSCGCSIAKLPATPWKIAPGTGGDIAFTVDLRGKFGTLSKYATVDTSHGQKLLNFKIHIPQGQMAAGVDARARNMQIAMADRQAVFRNDCASCHAVPTVGRKGAELYQAGCAICHDAPHRATMVPDLKAVKTPQTREYWMHWITNGKPGSLMPAFAQTQGGPLTQEQVESLADYLAENHETAAVSAPSPAATN